MVDRYEKASKIASILAEIPENEHLSPYEIAKKTKINISTITNIIEEISLFQDFNIRVIRTKRGKARTPLIVKMKDEKETINNLATEVHNISKKMNLILNKK